MSGEDRVFEDIQPDQQVASARGHIDAALVLTMAGLGWIILGLSALESVLMGPLVGILGIFAVLLAGTFSMQRIMRVLPPSSPSWEVKSVLRRATTFELIAIAAIVLVAGLLHKPAFIMPLIALAVGLHFFPLARALRRPLYYVTGGALCVVAVGVPLLIPLQIGKHHSSGWLLACGESGGAILWLTACALLLRGRGMVLRLVRPESY